jgi:MFS family permease
MLGAGGIFAVTLSAWAGRLPVLFYFLILATATAAWCAAATTFESFMAARILNGFFSTVSQGGGLMFIFDMFFFHERARKINIWAAFIILSPYMGPLFAAFIITTLSWPIPFWVYFVEVRTRPAYLIKQKADATIHLDCARTHPYHSLCGGNLLRPPHHSSEPATQRFPH